MPFEWIERVFGYCGLALVVFVVAAIKLHPDWGAVGHGFVPSTGTGNGWVYAYDVVGLVGAAMIPYEVYFHSSGAVEEQWGPKDLGLNRANVLIGYSLGGVLSFALMIAAGAFLLPKGISGELLGTVALVASAPIGQVGLVLALIGILFAVSGAAIDSAFAGAYNLAQFFGWEWGKYRTNAGAPRFTLTWIGMLVVGFLIVVTGVDPIMVTELSVVAAVVALPLTYVPILLVANDRAYMSRCANGVVANAFGVFYLLVVLAIAVAAIPLLLLRTESGEGLGRVHDLRAELVGKAPKLTGVVVGRLGLLERLGIGAPTSVARVRSHDVIAWSDVVRADRRGIVVRDGVKRG